MPTNSAPVQYQYHQLTKSSLSHLYDDDNDGYRDGDDDHDDDNDGYHDGDDDHDDGDGVGASKISTPHKIQSFYPNKFQCRFLTIREAIARKNRDIF